MKIPEPKKLPSGSWHVRLRLSGETIYITESSKRECETVARLVKAEYRARAGKRRKTTGIDMTLGAALDRYIASRSDVLSPSTIKGYQICRDNRFKGYMDTAIKDIDDWQVVINDEVKTGVSAKTIRNSWLLVRSVLRETTSLNLPKITLPQVIKKEPLFLEPEQIHLFAEAIQGETWELEALLALHGLRCSEIQALPISGIDTKQKVIKVRGAAVRNSEGVMVPKKENKNQASRRDVPIVIPRLTELVKKRKDKDSLVVSCHENTLRTYINRTCNRLKISEVGIHGLRHSFASLCYDLGIPEQVTMQLGGWADHNTMRKIYIHLSKRLVSRSQDALTDFFNKKAPS